MSWRPRVRKHVLLAYPPDLRPKPVAGFEIIDVTLDNVHRVLDFRDEGVLRLQERFLSEGRHGVFVEHEGLVVGHTWATHAAERRRVVNGYFPLPAGDTLLGNAHVADHVRGRGLLEMMARHLLVWALDSWPEGRVWMDIAADNTSSLRALEKMGSRPIATATFLSWRSHTVVLPGPARKVLR